MKFVPKAERQEWQKKALSAAKSEDLHSLLELFVKARAMERLADLVSGSTGKTLGHGSHHSPEAAPRELEKTRPGPAAPLWPGPGGRTVDAQQSKDYDAAPSNF